MWYNVRKLHHSYHQLFTFQKGFDVFTALDVMRNKAFLEPLKFTQRDNMVHYYIYNWTCPNISPDKVTTLQVVVIDFF